MRTYSPAAHRARFVARRLVVGLLATLSISCGDPAPTTQAVVETIEVTAPPQQLRAGNTVTLSAKVLDPSGNNVSNVAVYWSSSNTAVATVTSSGVVTALTAGEVNIAASALGKSATKSLTIIDREVAIVQISPTSVSVRIGSTANLVAQTLDAEGRALTGRDITWQSSNTAVATVSSTGVVTALAVGAATITATSEGRSGTAAVTATLSPVATVAISPAVDTLGVGSERTFTATLRDASNAVLTNRTINWNSSNVQVATVSSTGVISALAPGNAVISAVSEGRVGTSQLVVLARLASSVTLTPSSPSMIVGTNLQLTAQVTDPVGNILSGRPVSYVSDNTAIATVTSTGLVTAVAPGSARITATSEGKVGTAAVTVNPLPVSKVVVSPLTATLFVDETAQLTTAITAADGTVLTGRAVTWTSGAPTVASVSSTGRVTAIAPGVALILAAVEGVAGFSTITVQRPVIASVSITGNNSIAVNGTTQLTAVPRDNNGAALANRAVVWASSDDATAFVSSTGLVVGIKPGTVTVSATSEGIRGTITITVR